MGERAKNYDDVQGENHYHHDNVRSDDAGTSQHWNNCSGAPSCHKGSKCRTQVHASKPDEESSAYWHWRNSLNSALKLYLWQHCYDLRTNKIWVWCWFINYNTY